MIFSPEHMSRNEERLVPGWATDNDRVSFTEGVKDSAYLSPEIGCILLSNGKIVMFDRDPNVILESNLLRQSGVEGASQFTVVYIKRA